MSEQYFAKKISLRADEELVAVLHHHPISFAKQIFITALLILGSFFLMFLLFSQGSFGVALFLALLLTGLFYGLREFYLWYLNVFIITNQRIFDFDQKGFFNRIVSEVPFEKILDISYSVRGLGQTVLKLGTIKIQATGTTLILKNLKKPVKVNQLLADVIREQTGKKLEVKKVRSLTAKEKEQVTADFLNQEEFEEYEDYNLNELIEDYKETLGELRLKKLLVDGLDKYEEEEEGQVERAEGEEMKEAQGEAELKEELAKPEENVTGNFKQKKL